MYSVMPQSTSDMLRKAIRQELDQGADYSTTAKRNEFHKKFLKRHPDRSCGRTLISRRFKEIYEERGVDLYSVGLSRKKRYNTELADEINKAQKAKKESEIPQPEHESIFQVQKKIIENALECEAWTETSARAFVKCMLYPLTAAYPEIEMPEEDIDALAKLWLGTIRRYGSEKARFFGMLALGTISVIGPKIYAGYCMNKEKDSQTK